MASNSGLLFLFLLLHFSYLVRILFRRSFYISISNEPIQLSLSLRLLLLGCLPPSEADRRIVKPCGVEFYIDERTLILWIDPDAFLLPARLPLLLPHSAAVALYC